MKLNDTTALMTIAVLAALAICMLACGCGDNAPLDPAHIPPGSYVVRSISACTSLDMLPDGKFREDVVAYDPPSERQGGGRYVSTATDVSFVSADGTTTLPWSWDGSTLMVGPRAFEVVMDMPACTPPVVAPAIVGSWDIRDQIVTFAPGGELDVAPVSPVPGVVTAASNVGHWYVIGSQLIVTLPGWSSPGSGSWGVLADGQYLTLDNFFAGSWRRAVGPLPGSYRLVDGPGATWSLAFAADGTFTWRSDRGEVVLGDYVVSGNGVLVLSSAAWGSSPPLVDTWSMSGDSLTLSPWFGGSWSRVQP